MLAAQRKTPGVYVTELSAFPPSVVGVETAVPAFIGYTEKADLNGKQVHMKPIMIGSLADFEEVFGVDYPAKFDLEEVTDATKPYDMTIGGKRYAVTQDASKPKFYLFNSLRLFYANGGGKCYIVSVGDYSAPVSFDALKAGVDAIADQVGPTMLVVPDALLLPADMEGTPPAPTGKSAAFNDLTKAMLAQCGKLGDRVAVLDVYGSDTFAPAANPGGALTTLVTDYQAGVGTEQLSYGMAYFPCLRTSIVQAKEMTLANFDLGDTATLAALKGALSAEATKLYGASAQTTALTAKINGITATIPGAPARGSAPSQEWTDWQALNKDLPAALPVLKQVYGLLADKLNILPPSGAMAGIYTYVDATRGVWNAPANIGLSGVVGPTFKITSDAQGDMNVPLNGKAINAIRDFVGRGTLVWGARTLDGNSNDYRYIQVRRTLVYIEQSIKAALDPFVFAPNDGQTWVNVTAMISNFLTGLWTQGGLMGAKASDAFSVQCGLGSTMTGLDILNGYMRVQVTLQMIHPAEFIELTFTQKMQGVG